MKIIQRAKYFASPVAAGWGQGGFTPQEDGIREPAIVEIDGIRFSAMPNSTAEAVRINAVLRELPYVE